MNMELKIKACDINHLEEYGRIYAAAFSGEPWCDPWKEEDAVVHVKELLECPQSYGLECVVGNEVAGFLLGTSMLFHYGRTFEINDFHERGKSHSDGYGNGCPGEQVISGVIILICHKSYRPIWVKKREPRFAVPYNDAGKRD